MRVTRVIIYGRADGWADRLKDLDIRVSDQPPTTSSQPFKGGKQAGFIEGPFNNGEAKEISSNVYGRYLVLIQNSKGRFPELAMNIAEIEVYGY